VQRVEVAGVAGRRRGLEPDEIPSMIAAGVDWCWGQTALTASIQQIGRCASCC
jgi:hypothetical protein